MSILSQIIEANKKFVGHLSDEFVNYYPELSKMPARQIALFTCMDTRLVDFLEPAMGVGRGEAKVIKNAGNTVTDIFESTIRSLLVAIFELGVKEVFIIGHLDCGIAHATSQVLIEKMLKRGISPDAIAMVRKDLEEWLDHFHHPVENIQDVVAVIRSNPLIPKDVPIHGLVFNHEDGSLAVVVDGYSECSEEIGD